MKPQRGGTVRDPVTPGAPCPPAQPGGISHHREQPGDPSASRLRPGRAGAGEDPRSWTFCPRARLGSTTQETQDTCGSVSAHSSTCGLPRRPSCTAPSPLPAGPTCRAKAIPTRKSEQDQAPADAHFSSIALRSPNRLKSVKTTAFSELTAP